ncbi:hypothetical protein [Gorillibacterium massiliense]|uniref:hypothetical protein n=1 Tax=Gorillibacterium massiliense TaxID=1280390 RepID=UPI0004B3F3F8|nr:hypothetical protein [Gorillibacterium massiliense]
MRGFNIWRPIMLIAVALIARTFVSSICLLAGMDAESASSFGMIGMILAALFMYTRMKKTPRNR